MRSSRFFLSLCVCMLLILSLLPVTAFADIPELPSDWWYDDFVYEHEHDCTLVDRSFIANSPNGTISFYESPSLDQEPVNQIKNGNGVTVIYVYTDPDGILWGKTVIDALQVEWWVLMSDLYDPLYPDPAAAKYFEDDNFLQDEIDPASMSEGKDSELSAESSEGAESSSNPADTSSAQKEETSPGIQEESSGNVPNENQLTGGKTMHEVLVRTALFSLAGVVIVVAISIVLLIGLKKKR